MDVNKVFLCFVVVLFSAPKVRGVEQNETTSSLTGYGYELLTAKLEYIQGKLIEMEYTMKEDREAIEQKLSEQKTLSNGLLWAIDQKLSGAISQLTQTIGHNLTTLQTQSNEMLSQQMACANHEQMRREIQTLAPKKDRDQFSASSPFTKMQTSYRACKEEPSKVSGKYLIHPTANDVPFVGYCEQTRFGGGWLVFQHRFNGSVDFYRNWIEYRHGFGSVDGEFWLGLEHLHRVTSTRSHELLIELEDFEGNYIYARYSEFKIGSEAEQYRLKKLGTYTGTANDGLTYHKGMEFTTKDRDNDGHISKNCAEDCRGAWWYNACFNVNLNALYNNTEDAKAIVWYMYKSSYTGLAYTRMMIREV
uniref:Fibrinogen C-terminal domain-containing protein n=2 Tax=Anopheles arabiensis TaxID=7173 RepID=A0A8W7MTY0_ANOAR